MKHEAKLHRRIARGSYLQSGGDVGIVAEINGVVIEKAVAGWYQYPRVPRIVVWRIELNR